MKSLAPFIPYVELKNMFSYESARFDFETGVTLIEGFNYDDGTPEGSGKSAIPNSLCWGLFGKIPKDAKVDEVIREGAESGSVLVGLRDGFEVFRGRKPNELYLVSSTGEKLKGKDARETQSLIEKHLGMGFETFCQSVYFAQNYPSKFISAPETERAKIISEIQDLEDFTNARKKTQLLIKTETARIEALQNEVKSLQLLVDQAQEQVGEFERLRDAAVAEQKRKIDQFKDQIENETVELEELQAAIAERDRAELEEALRQAKEAVSTFQEQVNDLKVKIKTADDTERQRALTASDLERKEKEIKRLEAEINQVKNAIEAVDLDSVLEEEGTIQTDLDELEELRAKTRNELESIKELDDRRFKLGFQMGKKEKEIRQLLKDVETFQNSKVKKCPTCGGDMDATHAKKHVEELLQKKETLDKDVEDLEGEHKSLGEPKSSQELEIGLRDIEVGIKTAKNAKQELEKKRRNLEVSQRNLQVLESREKSLEKERSTLAARLKGNMSTGVEESRAMLYSMEEGLKEAKQLQSEGEEALFQLKGLEQSTSLKIREISRMREYLNEEESRDFSEVDDQIEICKTRKATNLELLKSGDSKLKQKQDKLARLITLKDAFQEVKQFVFKGLLSELTKKTNKYLVELFEVPIRIRFSNEDESGETSKINVAVTIAGQERSLGLYSGGQFRRISLAVDLALSEIISGRSHKPANLRVFDEPFKDLSEVSMEKALRLFETLKGCTVLIEHNSMVKSIVNKSYRVELRDKISKVVE